MLECKNIYKSFGSIKALQNVSIRIEPGEVRALVGGNGSGKSTLAKIFGGSYKADSGEIWLNGEKLDICSPACSKKLSIVITSQELSLLDNLTVFENLTLCDLPTKGLFIDRKRMGKMAREVLAKVEMLEYAECNLKSLAANQLYMLEFAKALIQDPKVLILDEITSALFRDNVRIVSNIINELSQRGCIIIFVSHRINEVYEICKSVSVMRNGELVSNYRVEGLNEVQLLSDMTGRDMSNIEVVKNECATYSERGNFISIHNLKLQKYGTEIDLDIKKGEIIGIAGLQGNGQSDLVRALYALLTPVRYEVNGKMEFIKNPKSAVKKGFAFVSGDREKEGTFANRSIMENLQVVTDIVLNRKTQKADKEGILVDYGVVMKKSNQLIRTLSGGNQQKVVLARWITANPRLLLLDDPTKGIDVNARHDIHRIMHKLADGGAAILYLSSDEGELVNLLKPYKCSRVIIMRDGRIVQSLSGDDITEENIMYYEIPGGRGNERDIS